MPIEIVSQGDENALGFTLTFDPAVLGNPQVALGADAAGGQLSTNTNQAAQGRLGIALALPRRAEVRRRDAAIRGRHVHDSGQSGVGDDAD